MKVHITNLNGISKEAPVRRWQNYLAEIGRGLGFLEMGIYVYPSEQEEEGKLSTRLDGIIASVEPKDVVFVQLPTGNGERFERWLIAKIKAYPDAKVIGILRDEDAYLEKEAYSEKSLHPEKEANAKTSICSEKSVNHEKVAILNMLDGIWVPYKKSLSALKENGLTVQRTWVSYFDEIWDEWHIRKEMLEIVDVHRAGLRSRHWTSDRLAAAKDMTTMQTTGTQMTEMQVASDEIQVAFCVTDRTGSYTEFVGIAMQSIVDHTKSRICFHVIHDGTIRPLHQQYLTEIAANSGDRVVFHQVDSKDFETDNESIKMYSVASLFRLSMPELLHEIPKIIYFDADLVFSIDIDELWKTDILNFSIGAVGDYAVNHGIYGAAVVWNGMVPREQYFNSGVLLMNLTRLREKHNLLQEAISFISDHPESNLPDQDALNVILKGDILYLDQKWNFDTKLETSMGIVPPKNVVYHFIGRSHIIQNDITNNDRLALETSVETPWNGSFVKNELNAGFGALSYKITQLQRLLSKISDPCCKKIYYGDESEGMKKILEMIPPSGEDYFIRLRDHETERMGLPCKEFDMMIQENKEKSVVILDWSHDGYKVLNKLHDIGFGQENIFVIQGLLFISQGGFLT